MVTTVKPTDPVVVDRLMELFYEPLEAAVHSQLSDCHCESKETVYTNTEFLMHTGFGPKVNKGFAKNGAYAVKAKCDGCGDCELVWIDDQIIWNILRSLPINAALFDWIAREQMRLGCTHMMQNTVISTPYTGSFIYWYGERHIICLKCGAEIIIDPDIRSSKETIQTSKIW